MIGHGRDRYYAPVLVTAPAALPVTLEQAKAQCRVGGTDEDDLITSLIAAATGHLDGWGGILRRCLIRQTWRQPFSGFADALALPFPTIEVVEVSYRDAAGTLRRVANDTYSLDDADGLPRVVVSPGSTWPIARAFSGENVFVTFVAGYDGDVPAPIKQAILLDVRRTYGAIQADADLKKEVVEGVGSREWDVAGSLDSKIGVLIERLLSPYRRIEF